MKLSSLRVRLLVLIVLVLVALLLPLGFLSAKHTLEEVDELSDGRLAQAARTLEVLVGRVGVEHLREHHLERLLVPSVSNHPQELTVQGRTFESEVGFQVFDRDGTLLLATENLAEVPPTQVADGAFEDIQKGKYQWRVFTLVMEREGVVIRAGERYDSRNEITRALWLEHGLPALLGLPLMAFLVGLAIRRGLAPLDTLAAALSRREPGSREPVDLPDAPEELRPVVAALNQQIERLEGALERERHFSADVAHELRTPLASTMINLEDAMASARPDEAHTALEAARACLVSLARRTEQLLALARLEAGAAAGPRSPVDLTQLALDVVDEMATVIGAGHVELGVELPDTLVIEGYGTALRALLRNLVENAFRHAPAGGHVQLSIRQEGDRARIEVADDGPGIAPERRAAMFTRFQRGADTQAGGYGLGLSIVQRAVELHGASIRLGDPETGTGLVVVVDIPLLPGA
ncbi:two-component system, OmpR family, sensor histidine kinase QseC [Luteibacter sp. UNC138MFCol5.1]|uniref:sensor histidine kinase n=1 Tax=Luteibacter sp. UNC138MFCol5.1 TaxID=1502774 RepID=UPI0008CB00DB|nr:ATP-binding protein [Luteibacter sp. UNC138MFCol5.1]SEO86175.1 two-component system, OmpR family, sensor histidine kinase QseC [Luteibacter sp. UNC138MFCol5.1]